MIAVLTCAGCDREAATERTRLHQLEAGHASSEALCRQAKRLKAVSPDIIEAQYVINAQCPAGDPDAELAYLRVPAR